MHRTYFPWLSFVTAIVFLLSVLSSCDLRKLNKGSYGGSVSTAGYRSDSLASPYATGSAIFFSKVLGWPDTLCPKVPSGFRVDCFARGLENPRWIYVADNGDVFVSEANTILKGLVKVGASLSGRVHSQHFGKSANRVLLFRDFDEKGIPRKKYVYLGGLNQPFGMLVLNGHFYVANTDGLWEYDYHPGDTAITTPGKKILSLPAGGYNNHWTRNLLASPAGNKIYVSVGSATNVAEKGMKYEVRRADILEINPDGSGEKIYAAGLRNPVGMAWEPETGALWVAVNERDGLGDELVPDYLTGIKPGAFYGWPYCYFGQHRDPRAAKLDDSGLVARTVVPDLALGSHTASLGLVFYQGKSFFGKYQGGAFVAQHGSWNRSALAGYRIVFIPFSQGHPSGPPEDFMTGFIRDLPSGEVYGRPVGIAVMKDGSMLVADDAGNHIWRISTQPGQ
jgi:glucose/arabinose dehydrogenase